MLVEFIGAAGVGKSFLCDRVLEVLRANRVDAHNFDLLEINRRAPRNLALMARAIYLCVVIRPTLRRLARSIGVIARYRIRRAICEPRGGVYLTSEGLFHRMITLHRNSRRFGLVQLAITLFRSIRPPDIVIVVEASAETIFARRSHRNRPNDVFSLESVRDDIAIVEECIDAILHVQRSLHPPLRLLHVNAESEGGAKAVADIAVAIEQFARNHDQVCGPEPGIRKKSQHA